MQDIQGRYLIYAPLPATYELSGEDRSAEFNGGNQNVVLDTICLTQSTGNAYARFLYNTNITLKRARVIARGAKDINAPLDPSKLSARFGLSIHQYMNGSGRELDYTFLSFPEWEKWIEFNHVFRPYKTKAESWSEAAFGEKKPVAMVFNYQNARFFVDDYNIQDAYVRQNMNTAIEMEIETSGIIDNVRGIIY